MLIRVSDWLGDPVSGISKGSLRFYSGDLDLWVAGNLAGGSGFYSLPLFK